MREEEPLVARGPRVVWALLVVTWALTLLVLKLAWEWSEPEALVLYRIGKSRRKANYIHPT